MASGLRKLYPSVSPNEALDYLRQCQVADGVRLGGRDQAQKLERWFRSRGFCLPKSAFTQGRVGAGAEHETFADVVGGWAIKLTHDGRFGHCLRSETDVSTPIDYLLRLDLHNELFGDDIRVHGYLLSSAGLRIVTTQPWIVSHEIQLSPTQDQIDAFLRCFGFWRSSAFPDRYIYYNREANLVIGDAQPANLLLDTTGAIRPIDLVVTVPDEVFRTKLVTAWEFDVDHE